jgi:hypothetical protein
VTIVNPKGDQPKEGIKFQLSITFVNTLIVHILQSELKINYFFIIFVSLYMVLGGDWYPVDKC